MRLGTGMASPILEKSRTSRTCITNSFRFEENSGGLASQKLVTACELLREWGADLRYDSKSDDSTKLAALRNVVRLCDRTRLTFASGGIHVNHGTAETYDRPPSAKSRP